MHLIFQSIPGFDILMVCILRAILEEGENFIYNHCDLCYLGIDVYIILCVLKQRHYAVLKQRYYVFLKNDSKDSILERETR